MLDHDLAMLYGVPTKALNQAVRRNAERFPDRFMFRLSESEMDELVTNCDRFGRLKHSSTAMCAFTEQGIAMLSSVLHSAIAVRVSVRIMDAWSGASLKDAGRLTFAAAKMGAEMIPGLLASIRKATSATNSYKKGGRK